MAAKGGMAAAEITREMKDGSIGRSLEIILIHVMLNRKETHQLWTWSLLSFYFNMDVWMSNSDWTKSVQGRPPTACLRMRITAPSCSCGRPPTLAPAVQSATEQVTVCQLRQCCYLAWTAGVNPIQPARGQRNPFSVCLESRDVCTDTTHSLVCSRHRVKAEIVKLLSPK